MTHNDRINQLTPVQIRKRLKMTQRQASELLGVRPQTISEWERGVSMPSVLMLPKIIEVYQCTADEVIIAFRNIHLMRQQAQSSVDDALSN
jgi:transcriptional regulator with XRE-family HTH domain